MAFPKFHGITLAQNAWIANAVVENLASDPVPITSGRIWFNTTAKALKFSSLDGGGAVIVETVATGAQVAQVISDLADLGTRVDAIEADYIKKDGTVAFTGDIDAGFHKLTNLVNGTANSDGVSVGQLNTAIANLGNAFKYVGTVDGGVDGANAFDMDTLTEKTAGSYYKATTGGYFKVGVAGTPFFANLNDGLVFNTTGGVDTIAHTESSVSGTPGFIEVTGTIDTGYVVDIDDVFKTRVDDVETGLADEIARATGVEGDLTALTTTDKTSLVGAINSEVARAIAAEGVLTTAISDEVTRATTAEGVLETAIEDEVLRATTAEDGLQAQIGDLGDLATTDQSNLVAAINEVVAAAGGGAEALKDAINAQRFTQLTVASALVHTITHGLNSDFVAVQVWTKGDDTVFRQDIVAIELTDANTTTVTLTESRIIKIVVQALDQLA